MSKFGGPPSKAFYTCRICNKEIRRDRIKEHYGAYVDLGSLNQSVESRNIAIARLNVDKRKHTEGVKEYYDKHKKLPFDFNNSEFWIKVAPKAEPAKSFEFFNLKRKNEVDEGPAISEKQSKQNEETDNTEEEGIDSNTEEQV